MDIRCIKLRYVFHSACWISTASLLCYWIYLFSLDEDICLVDYKKYYYSTDYGFPKLSFCLKDPFSEAKLRSENSELSPKLYSKFLRGKNFSSSMLKINYSNVVLDATKYVDEYYIKWRNGSRKAGTLSNESRKVLIPSYAGLWDFKFYNCYALQVPDDTEISAFTIKISNLIFPGGVRTNDYKFMTMLHTKNQLLTSDTLSYMYPRRELNDTYVLRYNVNGVEFIRRRNKRNYPCSEDWTNHDAMIMKQHTKFIGCTPPYFNPIPGIPICSSKDQMAASPFTLRFDDYGTLPPCQGMEKIYFNLEEKHKKERKGYFWFGLYIFNQKFKEIVQIKEIDLNGLIGYRVHRIDFRIQYFADSRINCDLDI